MPEPAPVPVTITSTSAEPKIIGKTVFAFSADMLEKYLVAALQFWQGKREPQGVDLEDTWKCNVCEYMEECEWREAKATAAESKMPRTMSSHLPLRDLRE